MRLTIFIACFIVWSPCNLQAQNPVFRVINNLNGLPSNTVYSMLQDNKGFIWVAHERGLSRFDGKTFLPYKGEIKQGRSLFNLMEYKDKIYCQDFAGNFYFTEHDSLKQETGLVWKGGFMPAKILQGRLLVSCISDTLRFFDLSTKQLKKYKIQGQFSWGTSIKGSTFKALSNEGIYVSQGKAPQLIKLNPFHSFFITESDHEMYGIAKNEYPYIRRLLHQGEALPLLRPGLFIQQVNTFEDEIWICTSTGAYCFDKDFVPKYNGFCFFEGTNISNILKDQEGNYWFSSLSKGIYFVSNLNLRLYSYHNLAITSLSIDKKQHKILAGTEDNQVISFSSDHTFAPIFKGASNHELLSVYTDTLTQDLFFCSNSLTILPEFSPKPITINLAAKNIAQINKDLYAVSSSAGVFLMSKDFKKVNIPFWLRNASHTWNTPYCYFIENDPVRVRWVAYDSTDSTLYAATTSGLMYYSPSGKGYILNQEKPIYGSQIHVTSDHVYVSTYSGELFCIRKHKVTQIIVNPEDKSSIYRFQPDSHKIWMVKETGLHCYDTLNKQFTTYDYTDGLPKAEIKDIQVYKGYVYLATTNGLVVFNQTMSTQNTTPPRIIANSFRVNNKPTPFSNGLTLTPEQNNIDILFSVLSFRAEEAITIRYQINNHGWQFLQSQARELNLPSLSPGSYTIQIQVFNEDTIPARQPLSFTFVIQSPFYKQVWFIILCILISCCVTYIYFRIRIRAINQKNQLIAQKLQLEHELQQSILTAVKSQMNPHFLFNALNTIQAYIYTNDKENAVAYLGKFSDLTRSILEMSSKEVVLLSEEIKTIQLYLDLEKNRFEDLLTYRIDIDPDLHTDFEYIPPMLIQPYLENAIKHGLLHKKYDRQILLCFKKEKQGILVTIDDNGIGRARSAELKALKDKVHQGFALNATQKRLNILNAGLQVPISVKIIDKQNKEGEPAGTCVLLHIPTQRSSIV